MNIKANNIDLYYEVIGKGAPLVMVHGNGETHEIFDQAVSLLSNHFTCYLPDSRGHGKSQKVTQYHYEDMAEDIYQMIHALQLEHVTYYGFSDGGIIGLLLASKYPDLFEKMIISGANTRPDALKKWIGIIFKLINRIHRDPLTELMLKEPHITKEQLASIQIPTLVLAGSKDLIVEEDTRFIAASIPNAMLKILDGENHGSYIVHKEKIGKLILEYCEKDDDSIK